MLSEKIRVTREMIINDKGLCEPYRYFAELDTVGDPAAGAGNVPAYNPGRNDGWAGLEELCFTVDFGTEYYIEKVCVYDHHQWTNRYGLRWGTPFAWENEKVIFPKGRDWGTYPIEATTQFLNFRFNHNTAPGQIVLYGYRVGEEPKEAEPVEIPARKLTHFFGVNGYINDADDIHSVSTYVREYHPWSASCPDPEGDESDVLYVSPSRNGLWDYDEFYRKRHEMGISVVPTIEFEHYSPKGNYDDPADYTDPGRYYKYASMLFQYIARYGSNKDIPDEVIRVGEGQTIKKGLGYIDCIEPSNEPNMTWGGRRKYFSPFELAALSSICYDGHEGKYPNVGVKQADPNCRMTMSGIAGTSVDYIRAMAFWAKYNRKDGKLPFDAINVHNYCGIGEVVGIVDVNLEDRGEKRVFRGVSPEHGDIAGVMKPLIDFRAKYAPEQEIWLTEFGWDTNQSYDTALSAHAYGEYSGRDVQAMWLVREYLILASIGVDRGAMFLIRDCAPEDRVGKFATSGLVTVPIDAGGGHMIQGNKKISFYYVYTAKELLQNTRFTGELDSHNKNVRILRFTGDDGKSIYALWCTTSDGTKVPGLKVRLPGVKTVTKVTLADQRLFGNREDVELTDGALTVDVSEIPIFLAEKE